MLRLYTQYFTWQANNTDQPFEFVFPDGYRQHDVKTVWMGFSTTGVKLGLEVNGTVLSEVDSNRFATGDPVLHVEFTVQPQQKLILHFTDYTSTGQTSIAVTIGAEVAPGSGP